MRTAFRRLAIVLLIVTGIYFLTTPFLVPWAVERQVRQLFADHVDSTLDFSHVAFNPFSLTFVVRDLDIRDRDGAPVMSAEMAKLNVSWRSLWAGEITISDLFLDAPNVAVFIQEDGSTNFGNMIQSADGQAANDGGSGVPAVRIGKLQAKGTRVSVQNHDGHKVSMGPTDLSIGQFAFHEGHAIGLDRFAFDVGDGKITATGALERTGGDITLDLVLDRVPVNAIAGFIPLTDIYAEGGFVSGPATLSIGENFIVNGDLTLSDFTMALAGFWVHKVHTPFANLAGFRYDMDANSITADTLLIEGGDALLVRAPKTEDVPEAADTVGPSFRIDQILVSSANLLFEDRTFAEAHRFPLESLDAVIDSFSYDGTLSMGFRMDASAGLNSPLIAAGFLEYGEELDATVSLSVDRLDHTVLAPYIHEAVGRKPEAGYAYLEFDYYVSGGEIDGLNTFLFDRWEWGDKDPAFEGEDIPIKKAFNLLEDKGGRVAMEIPVEGELLDPTFRVEKLVRKATNKAVSNILTTPFRLLGKLIPGGKKDDLDLDKVAFEPSSSELTALEKARLHALANALKERPKLRLKIEGTVVPDIDLVPAPAPDGTTPPQDLQALIRLANRRASAVYQYLQVDGISADRLENVTLEMLQGKPPKKPMVRLEILK